MPAHPAALRRHAPAGRQPELGSSRPAPTAADRSFKGRLRAFVWGIVGPGSRRSGISTRRSSIISTATSRPTSSQKAATDALIASISTARSQFQSRLMQLLQTMTLYVDTKDRSVAGQQDVLNAGLARSPTTWLKRWESLGAREDRFVRRLSAIDDVRTTATLAQQTSLSLKREVERLVSGTTGRPVRQVQGASWRSHRSLSRSQRVQIPRV